ncbi:MAG: bacillithiol biosynthesis cysteine-adding enzyme BshC [Chitinophagaceae bacterium]|nr:bacillithiol biosynthesis cysteine-adding enzyme BshC [Chitinophagaceae bacterium]
MEYKCTYIPYKETGAFSSLVTDYLDKNQALSPFYKYTPDEAGIEAAIHDRAKFPVNRKVLVETLTMQYSNLVQTEAVAENIKRLGDENTFTICTAHQPNLLTGYLYFIYKIAHAIQLAQHLNAQYPGKHFVPVYYMGSEDNDLDELGTFRYGGEKYVWDADGQAGAVGRMDTQSLKPLLDKLFRVLGPPGPNADRLKNMLTEAYLKHDTIGKATKYLVNELFGQYGLLVLDPDEAAFKKEIFAVLEDDLLNHTANPIVTRQAGLLAEQYKSQAYPRDINIFYLADGLRERIEKAGDKWVVLNTDISWTKDEMLDELKTHPERFSPNVILRGILQESILPNVAFIGGGAEVAYWLQLKELFAHYGVFYPVILLRQSIMLIGKKAAELLEKTGHTVNDLFKSTEQLTKEYIDEESSGHWHTDNEQEGFEALLSKLKEKAISLDPTLSASADAALARIRKQLQVLEKKMLRAEKRNHETELRRIERLKTILFPGGGLQERVENFIEYYPICGIELIDMVVKECLPLKSEFLVISL